MKTTNKETSIRVTVNTRERLEEYGRKGESFDDLLNRMVDYIETGNFASDWYASKGVSIHKGAMAK